MLTIRPLDDQPQVRHGFFSREGGVSEGLYASLNCGYGSGDRQADVGENRARAMARLGSEAERLVTCFQIHSDRVVRVERPWAPEAAPEADAMVTREPGLALGVLTADCAPVLLADGGAGVIGAAHAGWKGAIGGVLERTVEAMVELGAEAARIVAGIGPCIAQSSYEVGPEFAARFLAQSPANARYFQARADSDRLLFDLKAYAAERLRAAGVGEVEILACDTCAEEDRFFSYRRTTLRGETDYGRGLSAILLTNGADHA
jgi:YfiH family protein